ncbi:Brefeldin A-inhibited guanine nucleotide-exchange protein 3 [Lamellibrachia satsuma]|nr:Brefeldin A-inhibited guanine nucleotide-exchange protein 3 [Lamellibrachia satsuma]
MVLETSNVCSAGSVHVAAKATLTQLLTAVAEKLHYKPNTMLDSADCVISEFTGSAVPTDPDSLTSDVVTILAYLCDKLSVTLSNSSSNKQIIPLLLEGIYAVLSNVPVGIRDNHNFVDLIWQQLCPSLICILGNPLTDKSITSQKAALLQDEVGRGSGCSGACPQLGATARTIYTISVELVRLVGAVQSLRPVLESLFHRMLLYPPASHRLDALKTLTELFNSADRLIDLAGPVIIDTDCSSSSRKKAHSNLALLKLIIDSLEECSHCTDSAICVATVVLVCDLLTTVEHLVKGDSVEKIEEIQRINRIIEDVDTAPGTTLSSPPGWYASSSDTDSDADVKHDIPVRQTVTQVSETRDSCAVPASLPLKTDFDLIERQSASEYVQHLLIFLPSLLDCVSQSDVDHMMQKFSSDVCAALMTESQPASASVPLNADGVYLATYSALSLNLKLHLQGYYNSEEKSVPMTEMQFIDEILGTGLLLYLSRSWLSEVFHHIISSDLLALAGYTAAMTGHSDSPLIHSLIGESDSLLIQSHCLIGESDSPLIHSLIDLDGLQSHEVAGQMLSVYYDTSIMRSADSGTPALKIGPSFAKEILTVCWDGILDVLSSVLTERSSGDLSSSLSLMLNAREETEKARQAICLSLEGLQKAARLTSILGLQDRCGAVFARLASTSCVSEDCRERSDKKRPGLPSVLVSKPSPVRLPAAYALSMDVLLDIGLEMGSHSADCWTHVFKCCAHVASVEHTYFSGQSQTPRAVPESQSHGLDGASVSELSLYGSVMMSPQPVTPIVGVPELIQQSHIDAGWDSSIVAGGVLTPAVTSKVLCRLSQQVDRLFEDAANKLTMKTLISFLYQLCISSHHQLTTYNGGPEGSTSLPMNALHLYRLGDIMLKCAHSSRPLLHLMRAWCEVAPHFVEAACHQDRTISKKAVNCMHEVATALLSGWGEPAYWRFNEALCKPFENLLCLDMCDGDIQDQVICSIGELVEACSTEMRSGWRSLFGALRAVKIEYTVNEEVNEARQHHIANVLDVFDVFLNTDNVAVFSNAAVDCILCLQKYVHGTAMILWGQNTPIMPVHRRRQPLVLGMPQQCGIYGGGKNLQAKDLLSTSREEIQKIKTKKTSFVIWNVRTLHQKRQVDLLLDELENFNINIADISETQWCGIQQNGYTIIHSGREDGIHRQDNIPGLVGPPFSMEEVRKAVRPMKSRKAPGADRITTEVLRAGGEKMTEMLLKICNAT